MDINFFRIEHMNKNWNGNAVLILDNYLAHNIDMPNFSPCLTINFLPRYVMNKHQPADMGVIAVLKVGYKSLLLQTFLGGFATTGGYK